MGIFGKKNRLPGTNAEPKEQTKAEKDAWRKKQEEARLLRLARYNENHGVVAHHDSLDWPRKEVSKKAFRKHSKRARRFYAEANAR